VLTGEITGFERCVVVYFKLLSGK